MNLIVNFVYAAHVVGNGQRNARIRGFLGTIPVPLAELSGDEAPVVLRVRQAGAEPVEYRRGEGKLLLPCGDGLTADELVREAGAGWDRIRHQTPLLTGWSQDFGPGSERYDTGAITGPVEADPGVRRVVDSEFEARAAEVRERISDFVLVDGRPYRAAPEPFYVLDDGDVEIDVTGCPSYAASVNFRADERDFMEGLEGGGAALPSLPMIEVVDHAAIGLPLPHLAVIEEARGIASAMSGDPVRMKAMTVADFTAYADLRDAIASAATDVGRDGDRADLSGLAAAGNAAAAVLELGYRARGLPAPDNYRLGFEASLDRLSAFAGVDPDLLPPPGR